MSRDDSERILPDGVTPTAGTDQADNLEAEKICFDKRIAFGYGLATGLFIGLSVAVSIWR